ncbi:MAG: hypothetical protein ABJL99_22570 [Aliishimia sp.]
MLVLSEANLVFLAVPKTGTTSVEMALRPKSDMALMKGRKHITAQRYRNKIAPFLKQTFGIAPQTLAVMRDPIEQIRSWYRYRSGARQQGGPKSTGGINFDDFVRAVISDDPPAFAGIGSQFSFLTDGKGRLVVDHLFAYETQPAFREFLSTRLNEDIIFKHKNVSPRAHAPLSENVEAELRAARSREFALYDRLMDAGGYLGPAA